jgi:lysophospholipase L1-like esterase
MRLVLTAVMMAAATAAAAEPVGRAVEALTPERSGGLPTPKGERRPQVTQRFDAEVSALTARPLPAEGVSTLFLGSSSIRMWDVGMSFPAMHVLNRGFGGATTADVLHHYNRVVAGLQPTTVIVYVGENDIAGGATAEAASTDVLTLLARLRADMPRARIAYLSMKPTPLRWDHYARMTAANAAIKAQASTIGFDYVDVGGALLDPAGKPDTQYYGVDGLHLNARGYERWTSIVQRYLAPKTPIRTEEPAKTS